MTDPRELYEPVPGSRKSRIEGTLHRCSGVHVIRSAEQQQPQADGLMRLDVVASSEQPYLRADGWEEPWVEVLGHKPEEVDLSRLKNGAAVFANHDRFSGIGKTPLASIGKVESARLDAGRIRATLAISPREALEDLRKDIELGLVSKISIGYQIQERVLVKAGDRSAAPIYRVTRWQPFEISLVDVPADDTVGVGRTIELADASACRIVDIADPATAGHPQSTESPLCVANAEQTAAAGHPILERTLIMTDHLAAPTQPQTTVHDAVAAERARVAEIAALAEQYKTYLMANEAADAVRNGCSAEQFKDHVLKAIYSRHANSEQVQIGLTPKERRRYSFGRALQASLTGDWSKAGFERECSQAVAQQMGRQAEGFFLPTDMLTRDFNVGTSTEAGNLVATDLRTDLFTDVLRNSLVLGQLGAVVLSGLTSSIAIPRKSTASTIGTLTEIGSQTETAPATAQPSLTPKRVGAFVEVSKQAIIQSAMALETMIRDDLVMGAAVLIENLAINGNGTSPQHAGIRNTTGIGTVVGGTNGLAPAWSHFVDLESACANANAEPDRLAGYLINSKTRGKLKQTQFATNLPMIWQPGAQPLNGYRALVSNNVPSNLTKGTSTTVCSAALFGSDWSMEVIGLFGAPDVTVDPYSKADTGQVKITLNQFADSVVRQPGAFAKIDDLLS